MAGALIGVMDAAMAVARPGTESLDGPVLAATLALDVTLHILLGAALGLILGRALVVTESPFDQRRRVGGGHVVAQASGMSNSATWRTSTITVGGIFFAHSSAASRSGTSIR